MRNSSPVPVDQGRRFRPGAEAAPKREALSGSTGSSALRRRAIPAAASVNYNFALCAVAEALYNLRRFLREHGGETGANRALLRSPGSQTHTHPAGCGKRCSGDYAEPAEAGPAWTLYSTLSRRGTLYTLVVELHGAAVILGGNAALAWVRFGSRSNGSICCATAPRRN